MLSIIIPTLNEEKNIGNLLESLRNQQIDEEQEVIVADADSRDKTREIAKSYEKYFYRLLITRGGLPAVARNNGARASFGDPIFFIDADLILPQKDFLYKAAKYFRERNLAVATVYLSPRSAKKLDHLLVGSYNFILPIAKFIRPLGSMCILASREAFEKTGGYPEDVIMAEDHDFIKKCLKVGPYDIIPLHILMSVRRFDKEGRWGLVWKYLLATIQHILFGPISRPVFKYEFTYSEEEDKRGEK